MKFNIFRLALYKKSHNEEFFLGFFRKNGYLKLNRKCLGCLDAKMPKNTGNDAIKIKFQEFCQNSQIFQDAFPG